MQTHSKRFNRLSQIEQRAHHELYLSRFGFPISEESNSYLEQNPSLIREEFGSLFERDDFYLGDNNPFICPINRTLETSSVRPGTPLYQSDSSDSDSEPAILHSKMAKNLSNKTQKVSGKSSPLSNQDDEARDPHINYHNDKTPPLNSNKSSHDDENDDDQYDNDHINTSHLEDGEIVQYGLNGKPVTKSDKGQAFFISNQKKERLEAGSIIDSDKITRFVQQIRREDFEDHIENLVDDTVWEQTLIIYRSFFWDFKNPEHETRLMQIDMLELYLTREKTSLVALNNDIWNNESICQLLKDSYPKKNINTLDTFVSRAAQLLPTYNFTNVRVEQDFVMKALTLLKEVGEKNISAQAQVLILQSWVKQWSPKGQSNFKSFLVETDRENKTVRQFLQNLTTWCQTARSAQSNAEMKLWTVTPSSDTSWTGRSNGKGEASGFSPIKDQTKDKPNVNNNKRLRDSSDGSNNTSEVKSGTCNVCNRLRHKDNKCPFFDWHPFANKTARIPFPDSEQGKAFLTGHKKGFRLLDDKDLDGVTPLSNIPAGFVMPPRPPKDSSSKSGSSASNKPHYEQHNKKGNLLQSNDLVAYIPHLHSYLTALVANPRDLVTCTISLFLQDQRDAKSALEKRNPTSSSIKVEAVVEALLDSGSLAGDFISASALDKLGVVQKSVDGPSTPICSGLNNDCTHVRTFVYKLSVSILNENYVNNPANTFPEYFSFSIVVKVLPNTPFDLIIGKETIKKYNLPLILLSHFLSKDSIRMIKGATHPLLPGATLLHGLVSGEKDNSSQAHTKAQPCVRFSEESCGCNGSSGSLPESDNLTPTEDVRVEPVSRTCTGEPEREQLDSYEGCYPLPLQAPAQTHDKSITTLVRETRDLFAANLHIDDEIDDSKVDSFAPFLTVDKPVGRNNLFPENPLLSAILIEGDPSLQAALALLIQKYAHIFRNDLAKDPADIPPFNLQVDMEKWRNPKNRGPPRVQSSANQAETVKQLDQLLAQNIIERSDASYYSQVLLTNKPDGTKRFVIDYRRLNDCTESASWPLINIKQMFVRLGDHKSSIFGVMDLTSGYHQAPLSLAARAFTAFITFCGIFHYLRLPFGPKRAPPYFQEMMAAVVLAGLVYFICEIYLDDCIVHAPDNQTFLQNLEKVFQRFSKHKLFLKPGKCKFGVPHVEFCGRVMSKEGISMSKKKISQVLDFPLPIYQKQLKSFLGLVGYFRPHIKDLSKEAHPLQQMMIDYNRGTLLKWDDTTKEAFKTLVGLVDNCSTMYFVDPNLPLYLHTDASDFGIGGYLFQIIDGVEKPVAFISKSLVDSQLRWSTIQKEAYSIYYCCKELDYLLRDRQFILRTDHDNLRFIHDSSNNMIIRWFLALMELDFILEHIAGVKNIIADALSRLCANYMLDMPKEYTPEDIYVSAIFTEFKIPDDKYERISKVHNTLAGHHGVERTIKKLLDNQPSWPFLRQHVKKFVSLCPLCQKISAIKPKIHASPFVTSRYTPMECLNIDYVGPYPDKGYCLVFTDTFTRWIELFPVDSANSENTALCLLQHFGRFGAPSQLRSDQGTHFVNAVIREFLMLVGTEHCLTLAYSKEENALVERANKEVNRHLRAFTFDSNTIDHWRLSLPMVQRIMNATFTDRTKFSSSQLLFGNAINLDRGIFLPSKEVSNTAKPLSDYMVKMLAVQDNILTVARNNLIFADSMHLGTYPALRTDYAPGSFVIVKYLEGAPPTRLHTVWKGPLRVLGGTNPVFSLLNLITNKEKDYHVTDMKPFLFDPLHTSPIDVARKDYMEFFVESILKHSGHRNSKKTQLRFYIKWLGYEDDRNTWEPYANIRDMTVCHEYLRAHGMANHIPKKFTTV
jgi:transposase InsO family protein